MTAHLGVELYGVHIKDDLLYLKMMRWHMRRRMSRGNEEEKELKGRWKRSRRIGERDEI